MFFCASSIANFFLCLFWDVLNFAKTAFQLIFYRCNFLSICETYQHGVLEQSLCLTVNDDCALLQRLLYIAIWVYLKHCIKLMFVHAVAVAAVLVAAAVATVAVAAAVAADDAVAAIDIVVDCVVAAAVPDADAAGLQLVRSLIRSLVISCGHSSCK